jgi:hypothetical protein
MGKIIKVTLTLDEYIKFKAACKAVGTTLQNGANGAINGWVGNMPDGGFNPEEEVMFHKELKRLRKYYGK